MARSNLRAAFLAGGQSAISASHVFTDRVGERQAFWDSLEMHAAWLRDSTVSPVIDRDRPRRNVLTYYGTGGIGKTSLSQELERLVIEHGPVDGNEQVTAVRIDLAEDATLDLETFVLRLRAGLGGIGNVWPAFDLAFAVYWERAHPGEELLTFLDQTPAISRAARRVDLPQQLQDALSDLVDAPNGGLTGLAARASGAIYQAVKKQVSHRRFLRECDMFEVLLDAEADDETLSFMAYLLAWDLDCVRANRRSSPGSVVVFLDTFEAATTRLDRSYERLLQHIVYLMPNVLFVVTGRNRLDWAEVEQVGELDFIGADRWPGLRLGNRTEEPRQHLVGYLSDDDSGQYLETVLTRDGEPAIPARIRQVILESAGGLPLYLDLSVSHYLDLSSRLVEPTASEFGGPFTAVVSRTLRDLSNTERDLLRTAAMVEAFDAAVLSAALPEVRDNLIASFLRRSFLHHDPELELPYALHSTLRAAIDEVDTLTDSWSRRERCDVAGRILDEYDRRRRNQLPTSGRQATISLTMQALRLADRYGLFEKWLLDAADDLVSAGWWATFPDASADSDTPAARLLAGLESVRQRRTGDLERAAGVSVRDVDEQDDVDAFVAMHRAHAIRNCGRYEEARQAYECLEGHRRYGLEAKYWRCDQDYLRGHYRSARRGILEIASSSSGARQGESLRLLGHIHRLNADFEVAADHYTRAREVAAEASLVATEAKALTDLVQTRCWTDVESVAGTAEAARELHKLSPNSVSEVKLLAAEAVAAARAADRREAGAAIERCRDLADRTGYRTGHNLADVAALLLAASDGDTERAQLLVSTLRDRTLAAGGNFAWVHIVRTWFPPGSLRIYGLPQIEWLTDDGEVPTRWRSLVRRAA